MKKRKKFYLLFKVLIAVLMLTILTLIIIQQKIFVFGEEEKFQIEDNCQIILNSLIHPIKSDGECRIKCQNECELKSKKFVNSNFTEHPESCNECECICK